MDSTTSTTGYTKKVLIGVQARLGSKRFPRKVLHKIDGVPMILMINDRLKKCKGVDGIYYLIPKKDNELKKLLRRHGCNVICGSEEDVLSRYAKLAKKCDGVVRITGDCPLVQPEIVDSFVRMAKCNNSLMISNVKKRTFPKGLDVEYIDSLLLSYINDHATGDEREHVTLHAYKYFRSSIFGSKWDTDMSGYNVSVDTMEDMERIEKLVRNYSKESLLSVKSAINCIQEAYI